MKNLSLSLVLAASLFSIEIAQAQNYNQDPNYPTTQKIKATNSSLNSPQGWDGVGKPDYIPAGDNPKWYDLKAPTNSAYGNDYYRNHQSKHHTEWKKDHEQNHRHHRKWRNENVSYEEGHENKDRKEHWKKHESSEDHPKVIPENREYKSFHKSATPKHKKDVVKSDENKDKAATPAVENNAPKEVTNDTTNSGTNNNVNQNTPNTNNNIKSPESSKKTH